MMNKKIDWQVEDKDEYTHDTDHGSLVDLPTRSYIVLSGVGKADPNNRDFVAKADALYKVADYLANAEENNLEIEGYQPFERYPLQAMWERVTPGRDAEWRYQLMIRQPDFITKEILQTVEFDITNVEQEYLWNIRLLHFSEGLEAQIGNVGLLSRVGSANIKLQQFIKSVGYRSLATESWHMELYLNDVVRTEGSQWQTILRNGIEPMDVNKIVESGVKIIKG
ncbi:MAG TPA: hypothetical protein DCW31_10370 [Lactobacillus sp.]|nr:hypothetical protein [Lactobacillus sp.]